MMGILLLSFVLHFIADFLLQSRDMGKNKSSKPLVLAQHVGIQISVVFFGLLPFVGLTKSAEISVLNGLIHGLIDWNIWRAYKHMVERRLYAAGPTGPRGDPAHLLWVNDSWQYWEDHWFYATIGLDQLLHVSTLTVVIGAIL